MLNKERVLDDAARLAGGAAGIIGGLSQSIRAEIKSRVEETSERLDLVPRADFEKLEAMLAHSRLEQDALIARIEALETALENKKAKKKK